MRDISTVAALILLGSGAYAQPAEEAFARLLTVRSLRCELGAGTQASWDSGSLKLERSAFGEGAKVTFDSIDTKAGKARLIGTQGAGDVQVLLTVAGLTFIEQTAFGNLNFTTVFSKFDSAVSRRFIAVASRHQNINGPFPSQYHGTCSVLE